MSKLRPFTAPQATRPDSQPVPAPRFPGGDAGPTRSSAAGRPYTVRALENSAADVDLQAQLASAQQQVNKLQSQRVAHDATLEQERSKFHGAVKILEQSRARACRVLAKDAVGLAVEIAYTLAGRAFELDNTRVISLVETALLEFSSDHPIRVRVAPSEAPHVKAHLDTQKASTVQVEADPGLSPGDLSVEAEQLVVDARLIERVSTLREELVSAVRSDEVLEDEPAQGAEATE